MKIHLSNEDPQVILRCYSSIESGTVSRFS